MNQVKNEALWGWIFAFNPYTEQWCAFKREDFKMFYEPGKTKEQESRILKSKNIRDLEKFIISESKK